MMKKPTIKTTVLALSFIILTILCSSFNNFAFAKKPDRVAPTAPTNLNASAITETSITLSWTASTDKVGVKTYDIYSNSKYLASSTTTTYTVKTLTPATKYQYFVKAKDASGNVSAASNNISVTTASTPATDPVTTPTTDPVTTPTTDPVATPTTDPVTTPTTDPVTTPTTDPVTTPTTDPVTTPTTDPVIAPTTDPVTAPTTDPVTTPTTDPVTTPTTDPVIAPTSPTLSKKVVGYYAAWAAYSGYYPNQIDASKLTHINYAFANIGSDLKITLGYPDIDPNNIKLLNSLKQINPNLRTLISVGGWSWSGKFSDAALTDASRSIFADSCVAFITQYGFDGVDLDWEYPVSGGLATNSKRPEDKQNFTLLLQKIREKLDARGALDNKHYLLTIAGGADNSYVNNVEMAKLPQYLDYATIMTYDLHGMWDTYTDLHAPLYMNNDTSPQYKTSVDTAVNAWINASFPADKLVLGIPFYGYLYSSVNNVNNGLYQTYGGSNSISYQAIVQNYLNKPGYTRYFHSQSLVPWLFNGSVFISYEDSQSISYKTDYIKSKNLGGAMIWELSQDPSGELLNSLYNGMK